MVFALSGCIFAMHATPIWPSLRAVLVTAGDALYSVLTNYCEDILAPMAQNASGRGGGVERAIADRLTTGEATQAHISRALGMRPRTLSRRLAKEGQRFSKRLQSCA